MQPGRCFIRWLIIRAIRIVTRSQCLDRLAGGGVNLAAHTKQVGQ